MKTLVFLLSAMFLASCSKGKDGTPSPANPTASSQAKSQSPFNTDATLNEYVLFIPIHTDEGDFELETTMYHPNSQPPWPLLVINHGADGTLPSFHDQPRFRPAEWATFFLNRGYAVAAPMREGFAKSSGNVEFHCDHEAYAKRFARDITATISFLTQIGQVKAGQVVVAGQSNGGLITLGYGVVGNQAQGIINISGGIDTSKPNCDWKNQMLSAAEDLGSQTLIPSLWMYAQDDAIFPPSVSKPFYDNYEGTNQHAELKMYSSGGHGFALTKGSSSNWGPDVDRFLRQLGLPTQITGDF